MKGGFGQQGWSQQTPAVQTMLQQAFGTVRRTASRKRRKTATRAKSKRSPARRASSKKRSKPARMVKGSAAAKRYMASIRKKRK